MLIQTRGGGGGDSTSVECLFSITPLPGPVEMTYPGGFGTPTFPMLARRWASYPPEVDHSLGANG